MRSLLSKAVAERQKHDESPFRTGNPPSRRQSGETVPLV